MSKDLISIIKYLKEVDPSSRFVPASEKEKAKFTKIAKKHKLPSIIIDFYLKHNPKKFCLDDQGYQCMLEYFYFDAISELEESQKLLPFSVDKKEWKNSFFAIGVDNADVYFVDTSKEQCPVYVQFHDNPDYPNIIRVAKSFLGFLEFLSKYFKIIKEKSVPTVNSEEGSYYLESDGLDNIESLLASSEISSKYAGILKEFLRSVKYQETGYYDDLLEYQYEKDEGGATTMPFVFSLPKGWKFSKEELLIQKGKNNKIRFSFGDLARKMKDDDVGAFYPFLIDSVLMYESNSDLDKDFVRIEHSFNRRVEGGKDVYVLTARTIRDNISGVIFIPTQKDKHIEISFDVSAEEYEAGIVEVILETMGSVEE